MRVLSLPVRLLAVATFAALLAAACKPADPASRQGPAAPRPDSTPVATAAAAPPPAPDSLTLLARADSGRVQGAGSAPVWVVVASDFQCPYCKVWHDQTYPMIVRDYVNTGKVRIAYLNFPLRMHQHAERTAEAAMCAGVQGKFWSMHDAIFATQEQWAGRDDAGATALLDSLAVRGGVHAPSWRSCVSSHAMLPLIRADQDRSARAGVQSTPHFFIGERAISGAAPPDTFRVAIEQALAKTGGR